MPAIQIGDRSSLILQPGQFISIAPDGSATAKLSYKTIWSNVFGVIPTPLSPHPTFPQLLLYESTVAQEEGDIGRIDCTYTGVGVPDPEALTQFEFNVASTSEPVESHPLFSYPPESPPVSKTQIQEINKALEQNREPAGLTGAASTLYEKKLRGIDSFLRVGAQFRKSYIAVAPPSFSGVGHLATPSGAPTLPAGENYLSIGSSWRQAGGVVYITEDYQASGLGGWDRDLYA